MIEIEHLTKRFGRSTAVNDVSLTVRPGEAVALWGTNGAGKTTILRCLAGLYRYSGAIRINGIDAARNGKAARRLVGYVPQELGFNEDLRVGAAIQFFATLRGEKVCVDDLLARVHLAGHDRKRMRELSGGMKQRLALAIALIGKPQVLILDEVTASLDSVGRDQFVSLLLSLAKGTERCVLFASHRVEEIDAMANRVVRLEQGKVIADEPVDEFVRRMQRPDDLLHLSIETPFRQRAIDLLCDQGFAARMNGCGILVNVDASRRMRPVRTLTENRIEVQAIDMVAAESDRGHV